MRTPCSLLFSPSTECSEPQTGCWKSGHDVIKSPCFNSDKNHVAAISVALNRRITKHAFCYES